jgi:hypothetical protein
MVYKAAAKGNADAMYRLGLYENGQGVAKARDLYQKAANAGNADAKAGLALLRRKRHYRKNFLKCRSRDWKEPGIMPPPPAPAMILKRLRRCKRCNVLYLLRMNVCGCQAQKR